MEYAEKNVARGSFAVGAVAPDGVALAAVRSAHARSVPGAFLERRWRERVHRVDDTIACVACGLVPDALQLLAALRDFCRRHRSTWGEAPPVEACARHLGRLARAATARAAGRPYGAAFLIGGFDEGSSEPRLFRTEPWGAYEAYGVGGVATAGAAPDGSTIADLERAAAAFGDVADGADAAYAAAVAAAEASPPTDRSDAVATDVELAVLRPSGCVICDADGLSRALPRACVQQQRVAPVTTSNLKTASRGTTVEPRLGGRGRGGRARGIIVRPFVGTARAGRRSRGPPARPAPFPRPRRS